MQKLKKFYLLLATLVLVGAGCNPTKPTGEPLDYYVKNFSKAPSHPITELMKQGELVNVFDVNLETKKCDPNDENDDFSMCCSLKTKTFTPSVAFYTWKTTDWSKGGDVEFYIDDSSGKCVDGGFVIARGPFKDDLARLAKEAVRRP